MSDRTRSMVAIGVIVAAVAVIVGVLAGDPGTPRDRVEHLASRLKCPVCESESIADSPSALARDLKDLIAERVEQGWTDREILAFFVATYGEQVLLDPPGGARTAALWVLPVLAVGIGLVVIAGRRSRTPTTASSESRDAVDRALEERGR